MKASEAYDRALALSNQLAEIADNLEDLEDFEIEIAGPLNQIEEQVGTLETAVDDAHG